MAAMVGADRVRQKRDWDDTAEVRPSKGERFWVLQLEFASKRPYEHVLRGRRIVAQPTPLHHEQFVPLVNPPKGAGALGVVRGGLREVGAQGLDRESRCGSEVHRLDRPANPLGLKDREDPVGAVVAHLPDDFVRLTGPSSLLDRSAPPTRRCGLAAPIAEIVLPKIAVPLTGSAAGHDVGRGPLLAVVLDLDREIAGALGER
ncbi:MAG: hypothetical protein CNCCGFBP_01490 [Fimbriimonadaceae bacterium]|nr:hypothetical protein [Fimbriimonadaceae bacterium]